MFSISNLKQKTFSKTPLVILNLFKILFFLFLVGMICGAMLVGLNREDITNEFGNLIQSFISRRTEQSIAVTFFYSFVWSILLIIVMFFNGFLPIGQLFAFLCPIFHGLGLGVSTSYLYSTKGIIGILFCLLIIAPPAIISTIALILASKESIRFSNKNFKILFPERFNQQMQGEFKLYCIKFLALLFFQFVAAVVDAIFTKLFVKLLS